MQDPLDRLDPANQSSKRPKLGLIALSIGVTSAALFYGLMQFMSKPFMVAEGPMMPPLWLLRSPQLLPIVGFVLAVASVVRRESPRWISWLAVATNTVVMVFSLGSVLLYYLLS